MFLKEVWIEANPRGGKISWPNRKVVLGSLLVVLLVAVIVGIYILLIDVISTWIITKLMGR